MSHLARLMRNIRFGIMGLDLNFMVKRSALRDMALSDGKSLKERWLSE